VYRRGANWLRDGCALWGPTAAATAPRSPDGAAARPPTPCLGPSVEGEGREDAPHATPIGADGSGAVRSGCLAAGQRKGKGKMMGAPGSRV
jgi:hypothetical protein